MQHLLVEPVSLHQDSQDIASPTSPTSPLSDEEGNKLLFFIINLKFQKLSILYKIFFIIVLLWQTKKNEIYRIGFNDNFYFISKPKTKSNYLMIIDTNPEILNH